MDVGLSAIAKKFGSTDVLSAVDCVFPAGEISTILGVSGSGKTTLLRIIAGLEEPDHGDVFFGSQKVTNHLPQKRNVGLVFQDLAHYPHLTVEKNIALPLLAQGVSASSAYSRCSEIAADFGLSGFLSRQAGSLSGGEAQRLALARALVREPVVTLLDEPFSHLDPRLEREARRFVFKTLKDREATAVVVTHNHQDAQEAGGKVFFLENGRIVQEGSWSELYLKPATLMVARVVSFVDPLELDGLIVAEAGTLFFESPELRIRVPLSELRTRDVLRGQPVKLVVKQEDVLARRVLTAVTAEAGCLLQATIVGTVMAGPVMFYRLRHSGGMSFTARAGEPAHERGTEVVVDFAEAPKILFPRTELGKQQ